MQFGSFVDGLFAGAKSTAELMETKNKLELQYQDFKNARDAKALADKTTKEDIDARNRIAVSQVWNPEGTDTISPGSGSSTPPTEIREGITGTRSPTARNAGAPELTDRIAPLVSKRESSDQPYVGYTPENATPEQKARAADLSKNPPMPGYFGFPQWEGNPGPAGNSRAAGLFQFQPDTWKQYAGPLGITDFSPESQRRVFNAAYLDQGLRPWASNRAVIGDVAAAGLLGGAATSAARVGAGRPSALNAPGASPVQSPGSVAPDMEGRPDRVSPSTAQPPNYAREILKAVTAGGTGPAQQANVPEGYMTTQPPIPPPAAASPVAPIRSSALDPVATSAISSAMSPAAMSGSGSLGTATVTMPSPTRPVLAQLRQSDQGGGMRPPPMEPSAPRQQFAAGSRIIRLPDGTMVDGIGNIVRPAPSALYPTRTV